MLVGRGRLLTTCVVNDALIPLSCRAAIEPISSRRVGHDGLMLTDRRHFRFHVDPASLIQLNRNPCRWLTVNTKLSLDPSPRNQLDLGLFEQVDVHELRITGV